jgi:hypothetical protein
MEARIARLESDVGHLRSDVVEVKVDMRALRDKLDSVGVQLNTKIDDVRDSLARATTWAVMLYVALATAMLGTMARGFGWL